MKILGITVGHDSSACLVEDGKILKFAQEERYDRIKAGMAPPLRAIEYCLKGLDINKDIEHVVLPTGTIDATKKHIWAMTNSKEQGYIPSYLKHLTYDVPIWEISHHVCHSAASYFTSGFKSSLTISVDGIGENVHKLATTWKKNDMKVVDVSQANSLGWFYGMVTEALGWRMTTEEGKTMGLAPYGKYNKKLIDEMRTVMYLYGAIGYWEFSGIIHFRMEGSERIQHLIKRYNREDVAFAAQYLLEEKTLQYINSWLQQTDEKNLCVSGGVFMNVKLNQKIRENCNIKNFWAFPIPTDAGLSIGAALACYHGKTKTYPGKLDNLYLGEEFSSKEIKLILDRNKLHYRKYDVEYVAEALKKNRIVARFDGRMEAGARALGNRSILMSPTHSDNKDILNSRVKFREGFRPFCPTVLYEYSGKYFDGGTKYMIEAVDVLSKDIPAVTHVDGTARPQILEKKDNPKYYELIDRFRKKTGCPVLLNTSFNVKGEPIIRTPEQAIRCFYSTGIDILILGEYLLEKKDVLN